MDDRAHVIAHMLGQMTQGREHQRALSDRKADLERRICAVIDYRNGIIEKRDRKAAQIPLRPAEERMWATKIAIADESIAALRAELSAL